MADRRLEIEVEIQELRETISKLQESKGATQALTESTKDHSKSVLELTEHSRGFHKLLHAITHESPLLGLALHAAFSAPGAAVAALILSMHALKKAEEEAKKAAEEVAVSASKGFGDTEHAVADAVTEVRKAQLAHEDWVKSMTDGSKKVRDELDLNIAKLHAEVEAHKKVAAALGGDTGEVKSAVQGQELKLVQDAIAKVSKELADAKAREAQAFAMSQAETAAPKGAKQMGEAAAKDKADAERLKEEAAKAAEARAEASENVRMPTITNTLLNMISPATLVGGEGMGTGRARVAFQQAQAKEEDLNKQLSQATARAKKESELAEMARDDHERLKKASEDAGKAVKTLTEHLDELQKKAATLGATSTIAAGGELMAGETEGGVGTALARGVRALRAQPSILAGQAGPSPLFTQSMKDFSSMMRALHEEQLIPLIAQNLNNFEFLGRVYQQLKARQDQLAAQLKNTHAP